MKIFAIVGLALAASSLANGLAVKGLNSQRLSIQSQQSESMLPEQQEEVQATPYHFSYDTQSEGSQSTRTERGDASGKVIGQYAIKGADGIQRLVSYTADSEGFKANISTNEPGTESQNPSFIVLQSSQLPAADISRQLQTELDLAQQEEQPLEETVDLPAQQPAKSFPAPRKASPVKSTVARRTAPKQQAQAAVPVKSRRPQQSISAPSKRPVAASPSKGMAIRTRGPSKSISAPSTTTTQRPKLMKRPMQQPAIQMQQPILQMQEQVDEQEDQLSLTGEQTEEASEGEQDSF